MSEYEYKISAPLRNLITFNGSDGKPLLVIDGEKRRIEVSEGVDVSESARAVLAAIEVMLWRGFAARGRDETLEEAARVCDLLIGARGSVDWVNACMSCIAAIRALKDKR